jgi:hypothetical protein
MTTKSRSGYAPPTHHERIHDALGKPAASIRYSPVTDKWGVDVFHDNGVEVYAGFRTIEEAAEFVREELGE